MSMDIATMTSKGQITISLRIRKKLNLQQGDKVVFIEDDSPNGGVRILNTASLTFKLDGEVAVGKG